jgi:hypothetical protein
LFERAIQQHYWYFHAFLAFLCLAVLVVYYVPPLARNDVYSDDMREHIAWYSAAKNPALFQHDIIKTYFTAMSPLGFKALFSSICMYVSPQILGEILSLLLGMAGVLLAYKLGEAATSGSGVGGTAAVLLLLFGNALGLQQFIKVFQGGLQRAFALPILLLGTWALLRRRAWHLSAALVLAALFFPPVCVVLVVFSASVMVLRLLTRDGVAQGLRRDAVIVVGASVVSASLLLLTKGVTASHGQWTVYTLKDAAKMPEYYAGGIWDTLWDKPILYAKLSDYLTQAITIPHPIFLLGVILVFLWRARRFRAEVLLLMASAAFSWGVAYIAFLRLYEPSRYILYPLMTLWLIVLPVAVVEAVQVLEPMVGQLLKRLPALRSDIKTGLTVVSVLVVVITTSCLTIWRIRTGQGGMMGTAPPEVYRFLNSLPSDVKIAAHPMDADDIPMRSQRSVLAFRKAMFPYHREFYEQIKDRIAGTWRAMYATNYDDILQLRHRFGADVLLINKNWYVEDPIKAKPYDAMLEAFQSRLQHATPLVLRMPPEAVMFEKEPFIILDLAALDRLQGGTRYVQPVLVEHQQGKVATE